MRQLNYAQNGVVLSKRYSQVTLVEHVIMGYSGAVKRNSYNKTNITNDVKYASTIDLDSDYVYIDLFTEG